MRRYRRKKKKIIIISLICIFVVGITIFTFSNLKKDNKLNFIEKTFKDTGTFIVETFYAPVKFVKEKIEVSKEKESIYKKYKELEKKEESYNMQESRIKELEKENDKLKKTLDINESLSEYKFVNATVVSRKVGFWYNTLTINKGESSGIKKNMAVIVNEGLIGYISTTSKYSSNVQLLTEKELNNKISVKIELDNKKYTNALLSGYDSKKDVYIIEGLSYTGEIKNGAAVTTTGLNDNLPSGLYLGKIENIKMDNYELSKIIEVKPSVDYENIEYVSVLERKVSN